MKFSPFFIIFFLFAENVLGQTPNFRAAGICFGIINASLNTKLIQMKDIPDVGIDIVKKYNDTIVRIENKIKSCNGKFSDIAALKMCEDRALANKNDIEFLGGMDAGGGWILAGQAQGRSDVAIFKIKEICTSVNYKSP